MPYLIRLFLLLLIMVCGVFPGCHRFKLHGIASSDVPSNFRAFEKARANHDVAIERLCDGEICDAEQLLRDALVYDPGYGPAHNTLGKLYYDQRKYYLAAWEFDKAQALMPGRAEPANNLGLVFEAVENYEIAIQKYGEAWSQEPDNIHFLANLVRCRVRSGDRSSDLIPLLKEIIQRDERTEWVDWAKGQLALGKVDEPEILVVEEAEDGIGDRYLIDDQSSRTITDRELIQPAPIKSAPNPLTPRGSSNRDR